MLLHPAEGTQLDLSNHQPHVFCVLTKPGLLQRALLLLVNATLAFYCFNKVCMCVGLTLLCSNSTTGR